MRKKETPQQPTLRKRGSLGVFPLSSTSYRKLQVGQTPLWVDTHTHTHVTTAKTDVRRINTRYGSGEPHGPLAETRDFIALREKGNKVTKPQNSGAEWTTGKLRPAWATLQKW